MGHLEVFMLVLIGMYLIYNTILCSYYTCVSDLNTILIFFFIIDRETGALCAMKEVELYPDDPKSAECIKQLEQEINVLSKLKHPNIVQYYGSEIVSGFLFPLSKINNKKI